MTVKRFKIATQEYDADCGPWGESSAGDLMKYQFVHVAGEKDDPEIWDGEWYCTNEDCTVREVIVSLKYEKREEPRMKCPLCGKVLKFHHALQTVPLLPEV